MTPARSVRLPRSSFRLHAVLLACALATAACGGSGSGAASQATPACSAQVPCPAGQRCASGACVQAECADGATRPCGPQAVGACRQGTQTCIGGLFDTACPGQVLPSAEICDAGQVDENCDGAANEGCGCAPIGQTAACCSGRGEQTCLATGGGSAYSACSVASATETCNGLDDDCDGLVDEEDPPLCAAGNACVAGACGCPGGAAAIACVVDADGDLYSPDLATQTSLCPAADRPAQGGCPAGFVLPALAPGLDCDDTDAARMTLQSLRSDQDGDLACVGAATLACTGVTAPAGLRPTATCGAIDDCDDTSAAIFTLAVLRTDADGDTYCTGAATSTCIGAAPPAGRRHLASCQPTDDCNDANGAAFTVATLRVDADADGYCAGAAVNLCAGATVPNGYRIPSACQPTDDCNDANGAAFTVATLRADADADGYCAGAAASRCIGASVPAGFRVPASCQPTDDCNDASASAFTLATVRLDADNDGYCLGAAFSQCVGASLPAGVLPPASCLGDDCRDSNQFATTSCTLFQVYTTSSATKACAFVPPTQTFTVSVTSLCPLGFQLDLGSLAAQRSAGTGSCTAVSATSLTMTCNGLDGATCRIVGSCTAI